MTKYFLICASADHVLKGVEGGFAQAGHGSKVFMSKPAKGDWLVYYSAKDEFENGKPLQEFTAIGQVSDEEAYQPDTRSDFKPYRRNVQYSVRKNALIRPLLKDLGFIKNKERWGFYLISGFKELSAHDFEVIKHAMLK